MEEQMSAFASNMGEHKHGKIFAVELQA